MIDGCYAIRRVMERSARKRVARWGWNAIGMAWLGLVLAGGGAGCTSLKPILSSDDAPQQVLSPMPEVPVGYRSASLAILATFFDANGMSLTEPELLEILSNPMLKSWLNRSELRRIVNGKKRMVVIYKADEKNLWEALRANRPLLLYFPKTLTYSPDVALYMPVEWDREAGVICLLDGNNEILEVPEDRFFELREPLKHAALCLVTPRTFKKLPEPTREQRILLADFWYDQGFYRRAEVLYSALQEEEGVAPTNTVALVGRANSLVKRHHYREAIPLYRQALTQEPDNPKLLNNLAYSMMLGGGELFTALRHATKAERLDPTNPLILETIGSLNYHIGEYETAARFLERAWARSLKRSPQVQMAIMDQLTRAWLGAKRTDLAWQVAEYRFRTYPEYRMPKDLLEQFPILRRRGALVPAVP